MKLKENQVTSELIFDGKVVHLYKDTVKLPNQTHATREYVKHVGAVCVIPLTNEGDIIFVRQYRYAVGEELLEIPAGKLDFEGEDPLSAACRELREETGAVAGKMVYMGVYYGSPAIMGEKIHMYLAKDLGFTDQDLDEDEFLEVEKIPLKDAVKSVLEGKISDGKTQVAILRADGMIREHLI